MSFELFQFTSQEAQAAIYASVIGLVSGILAVMAALAVGLRQSQIMKVQIDIAARMVEVEEIKLKSELYDRRIEVFASVRELLSLTIMTGKVPGLDRSSDGNAIFVEAFQRFQNGSAAAQFLFDQTTRDNIENIYQMLVDFSAVSEQIRNNQSGLDAVQLTNAVERRRELKSTVEKTFRDLAVQFPQLNLTVGDTSSFKPEGWARPQDSVLRMSR